MAGIERIDKRFLSSWPKVEPKLDLVMDKADPDQSGDLDGFLRSVADFEDRLIDTPEEIEEIDFVFHGTERTFPEDGFSEMVNEKVPNPDWESLQDELSDFNIRLKKKLGIRYGTLRRILDARKWGKSPNWLRRQLVKMAPASIADFLTGCARHRSGV